MIDLHLHSNCSDGKLSVKKLAEKVIALKLKYCALTDHDTVSGQRGFGSCLLPTNIRVLTGVELTALYKDQEIHVLAYNFDLQAAEKVLLERNKIVNQQKAIEFALAKKLLTKVGFKISPDLVFDEKKPVGYTLGLDIYNQVANHQKLIKDCGHLPSTREFYDAYQAPGRPCYTKRSGVTVNWILEKFSPLTTDLVIAHPFREASMVIKALTAKEIEELIELGLKGLEIYHPNVSPEQLQELEEIVKHDNLLMTGGSDYHDDNDPLPGHYEKDKEIKMFRLSKHKFGC